jgi:hypothetical protein
MLLAACVRSNSGSGGSAASPEGSLSAAPAPSPAQPEPTASPPPTPAEPAPSPPPTTAAPTASPPPTAAPTPQPGLVVVRRQYDAYVGNILIASDQRSLVWCFDPSQSMLLKGDDVIEPYGGQCPPGVLGWIRPEDLAKPLRTPGPGAPGVSPTVMSTPLFLPSGAPLPLTSLPPRWRMRVYRPFAPPTP